MKVKEVKTFNDLVQVCLDREWELSLRKYYYKSGYLSSSVAWVLTVKKGWFKSFSAETRAGWHDLDVLAQQISERIFYHG